MVYTSSDVAIFFQVWVGTNSPTPIDFCACWGSLNLPPRKGGIYFFGVGVFLGVFMKLVVERKKEKFLKIGLNV